MKELEDRYFKFLDELRELGTVNMFGAVPYLQARFPGLSAKEARKVLTKWMETFKERKAKEDAEFAEECEREKESTLRSESGVY